MKNQTIMKTAFFLLGAGLILSCASVCKGAIYYWDGNATASPTTGSDPNISVGSFTRANGGGTEIISSSSPSSGYAGVSGGNNFQASANNLGTTFFSVTLTPAGGYAVTLNSISLGSRSTSTGPTLLSFYSSIDNFATAIGSASVSANTEWALKNVTFGAGSLTGNDAEAIEFRVFGTGGTGANAGNWRIDDISLTVTAVPEPAEWGLISAIGLFGICGVEAWRRKRMRPTLAA